MGILLMKCTLCLKDGVSLCNSHVFPEFLYKEIYEDDKHIYYALSTNPDERVGKRRSGIYERLLCRECESKIQRYEDYAAKVLYGGTRIGIQRYPEMLVISSLDYNRFKLFQLSLLWRAGVSKRKEFRGTDIGVHTERIRRMLLMDDPGDVYDYGCIVTFIPSTYKIMRKVIYPPERIPTKVIGHTCYRAIFGGLIWAFFVSSHLKYFPYPEAFLSKEGTMRIYRAEGKAKEFIKQIGKELVEANPSFI